MTWTITTISILCHLMAELCPGHSSRLAKEFFLFTYILSVTCTIYYTIIYGSVKGNFLSFHIISVKCKYNITFKMLITCVLCAHNCVCVRVCFAIVFVFSTCVFISIFCTSTQYIYYCITVCFHACRMSWSLQTLSDCR